LFPGSITPLDFSEEAQKAWKNIDNITQDVIKNRRQLSDLSIYENRALTKYSEGYRNIWDIIGNRCSWYCGALPTKITASSYLLARGRYAYMPQNIYDLNYKTAWIEGDSANGIGEFVSYQFNVHNPRITDIIIVNGYVKDEELWKNNGRVKTLLMYVNDKPRYILHVHDTIAEQRFTISPIGYTPEAHKKMPDTITWNITFQILEVYKGEKFNDIAISEIYFDGIDVHCLAKGTRITMADGTYKAIEHVENGDTIVSFNENIRKNEDAIVHAVASPTHCNLITIYFSNKDSLTCTADHPFFNANNRWISYSPKETLDKYNYRTMNSLHVGSEFMIGNTKVLVVAIKHRCNKQQTFTIVSLSKNKIFYANGIPVGTEELKELPKFP